MTFFVGGSDIIYQAYEYNHGHINIYALSVVIIATVGDVSKLNFPRRPKRFEFCFFFFLLLLRIYTTLLRVRVYIIYTAAKLFNTTCNTRAVMSKSARHAIKRSVH